PYFYRVRLDDSAAVEGQFSTAPASDDAAAFDFVFGACLGGQGYCRNPETGWEIFDFMLAEEPDFFLLTGDGIYSDSACPVEDGRNVPGAETVARSLPDYYARYRYHLEDEHYAGFLAQTPVYVSWDDHEIFDNFGGPELNRINPQMWQEGRKAFFDYWTIHGAENDEYRVYREFNRGAHADFFVLDTRSYRDPLVNWDTNPVTGVPKTMLGADQFMWLQDGLAKSDATWKFIVSSVPLAFPTGFPQPQVEGRDGWANAGNPSGYETELMRLLYFIEAHDIKNVVFITGDTHWPFAVSFDPDLDGEPNFYEISSSPMSAIVLPPAAIDQTFNPTVLYAEGEFQGDLFNFGQVSVDADGNLSFRILDKTGIEHFKLELTPR
ncbi:MAG TPA: alkaline phosphatase D family protein, partial [Aggregatilineales bacterium]|nr:alkaline phosphatase D family protein [Aggregatilineales bacterium]